MFLKIDILNNINRHRTISYIPLSLYNQNGQNLYFASFYSKNDLTFRHKW